MANADIIVDEEYTTVLRSLRLGGMNGETSNLRLYTAGGEEVVRMVPGGGSRETGRPDFRVFTDEGATVLRDGELLTDYVNTDRLFVSDELTAREGIVERLQLGGGSSSEEYDGSGSLAVLNEDGAVTVEIDGSGGSIRHQGELSRMSDARLKRRVEDVDDALETVRRLRGVSYEWDRAGASSRDGSASRHVGFLAQDVERVIPEAVDVDAAGRLGTVDAAFTPYLVEALKEQQSIIDTQSARLAALEERLDALEAAG